MNNVASRLFGKMAENMRKELDRYDRKTRARENKEGEKEMAGGGKDEDTGKKTGVR